MAEKKQPAGSTSNLTPPPAEGEVKCPSCSTVNKLDSENCIKCGYDLWSSSGLGPGSIVDGKYEVVSLLGAGGMGEVFKVTHIHLGAFRTIKVMKRRLLADNSFRQRFLREARIATKVHHPNVAIVHDFATLPDGSYYMVSEFIDGITLRQWSRKNGRFPLYLATEVAIQVLSGLEQIHRLGLLHRDISADNIMIALDGEYRPVAKIIDLGIAKALTASEGTLAGSATQVGLFIGNPKYSSPEQLGSLEEGEDLDGRADLYCLGVVLYEMVAGVPPFVSNTPHGYMMKHLTQAPPSFVQSVPELDLPVEFQEAVFKALQKDRKNRYQNARAFGDALRPYLTYQQRQPTVERPPDDEDVSNVPRTIAQMAAEPTQPIATPPPVAPERAAEFSTAEATATQVTPREDLTAQETLAFDEALAAESVHAAESFLERYPDSGRADRVRELISEWRERDWAAEALEALARNDEAAAEQLLAKLRDGRWRAEVEQGLRKAREERAWNEVSAAGLRTSYVRFLENFPDGRHLEDARGRLGAIEQQDYEEIVALRDIDRAREFMRDFPQSQHVEELESQLSVWVEEVQVAGALEALRKGDETAAEDLIGKTRDADARKRLEKELTALRDEKAWTLAAAGGIDELRTYVARGGKGAHLEEATRRLEALEKALFEEIRESRAAGRVEEFRRQFPKSKLLSELDRLAEEWKVSAAVDEALSDLKKGKRQAANGLVSSLRNRELRERVRLALSAFDDETAWNEARADPSAQSYRKYLKAHSGGKWVAEANAAIAEISALAEIEQLEKKSAASRIQEIVARAAPGGRIALAGAGALDRIKARSIPEAPSAPVDEDLDKSTVATIVNVPLPQIEPQRTIQLPLPSTRPALLRPALVISAILIVVAIVAFLAIRFGGEPTATVRTDTTATTSTQPTGTTIATLAIDARPWGEVQQVVDESGKNWLQTPQHTPVVLQLAPGRYTIGVRSRDSQTVSLAANLTSGQLTSSVAEFKVITPGEYFRSIGWE